MGWLEEEVAVAAATRAAARAVVVVLAAATAAPTAVERAERPVVAVKPAFEEATMAEGGAAATVVAETAVRAAEVREVCCCFRCSIQCHTQCMRREGRR